MATAKSVEKSKTNKNFQTKSTKKPRMNKVQKIIDAQPIPIEPKLVPISPDLEEKLTKSYYSTEIYLKGFLFSGPLLSLYLLYMIVKSKGELLMMLNFLGAVVFSVGLLFSFIYTTK